MHYEESTWRQGETQTSFTHRRLASDVCLMSSAPSYVLCSPSSTFEHCSPSVAGAHAHIMVWRPTTFVAQVRRLGFHCSRMSQSCLCAIRSSLAGEDVDHAVTQVVSKISLVSLHLLPLPTPMTRSAVLQIETRIWRRCAVRTLGVGYSRCILEALAMRA